MFDSLDGLLVACTRQNAGMLATVVFSEIFSVPEVTIAAEVTVVPLSSFSPDRAAHSVGPAAGAAARAGR